MTDNIFQYKNFYGSAEYSAIDDCFFGKIIGISDLVTFEGESSERLKGAFMEAVEEYLALCAEVGKAGKKSQKLQRLIQSPYYARISSVTLETGTLRKDFKAPGIKAAFKKLQFLSMTKEEQRAYEAYIDVAGEKFRMLDTAMHDGIEKGIEEGIKLVAKNLLSRGVSIDIIVESTGLSEEELRGLSSGEC